MNKKQILLLIFVALLVASVNGTVFSSVDRDVDHVIRISFLGSPEDEDYDGSLVFKQYVESRSNGQVAVEIYPSGQFCSNERECIEGLQTGVLQTFILSTGSLGSIFGPGQVLDLPYIFRDDAVAECVLDGPLISDIRNTILNSKIPLRLMTVSNTGGWRNFASTDSQIRLPNDVKGKKFRTISAPIQQELVRQLGGNPTPIAWSEVYTALATGVVEGTKNGIQDIVSMKLHEQIKFIILDGHSYMGGIWWFSEISWQQYSPDLQRIIYDGFQELKVVTRGLIKRREIDAYREFEASGGTLYAPSAMEKLQFQKATSGIRNWYVQKYGTKWLNKLDTAIDACELKIDAIYADAVGY
tara:strand:- start:2338 stop:3405 length:1068 start_codon:yes stop_codon:yes gene_type:complete